ncbi:hypothetical protein CDAR_233011 [Caerostris darwini]|uniref:Uncharacterized protein n=1 Tax=Caerostris darwini TaxID=1538125 RepID=A0AAV4Q550_9ARAC|nr:hypothetical protein CDAR_233011 [Caerostris darwini]
MYGVILDWESSLQFLFLLDVAKGMYGNVKFLGLSRAVCKGLPNPVSLTELKTALQCDCFNSDFAVVDFFTESLVTQCKHCMDMTGPPIPY